jgi:hypothetical protein
VREEWRSHKERQNRQGASREIDVDGEKERKRKIERRRRRSER